MLTLTLDTKSVLVPGLWDLGWNVRPQDMGIWKPTVSNLIHRIKKNIFYLAFDYPEMTLDTYT